MLHKEKRSNEWQEVYCKEFRTHTNLTLSQFLEFLFLSEGSSTAAANL